MIPRAFRKVLTFYCIIRILDGNLGNLLFFLLKGYFYIYLIMNYIQLCLVPLKSPAGGMYNKLPTIVINLLLDEVHFSFGFLVT